METGNSVASFSNGERLARCLFWVFGLTAGAILTYATRYYLNSDGINYIEMADAFSRGKWSALVNLTESPGYAFVMGVAMLAYQPDRLSEVPFLKVVNFVGLAAAMASCELFVTMIRREADQTGQTLPLPLMRALMYGFFLFAALDWIRMRLVAPDIFVFALVLAAMSIVLRIKQTSPGLGKSLLLGAVCGLGYLFKSFFFPFSWVFFGMAALVSGSIRKGVSTMVVAALTMWLVASPLILALSEKAGRFSYGEAGNYNYAHFVSGRGEPVSPPVKLHRDPEVFGYDEGLVGECTYPPGFDLAVWSLGIRPVFDPAAQLRVIPGNLLDIFRHTPWLFLLVPIWFGVQAMWGRPGFGRIVPPSAAVMCGVTAVLGIGLFSLVVVEIRYVAPFLFLGFVGLLLAARHNGSEACSQSTLKEGRSVPILPGLREGNGVAAPLAGDGGVTGSSAGQTIPRIPRRTTITSLNSRMRTVVAASALGLVLVGMCAFSVVEQAYRGLSSVSGKPSYREALAGQWSVARYLNENGARPGDKVGIVGSLSPYWARLAGVKIVVAAPDAARFLGASSERRAAALRSAECAQAWAMIGYGEGFAALTREGWQAVPGSLGYYCRLLDTCVHR